MKTRNTVIKNWKFPKKLFRIFLVFIMLLYLQLCYLTLSPSIYGKNMKEFAENRNTGAKGTVEYLHCLKK